MLYPLWLHYEQKTKHKQKNNLYRKNRHADRDCFTLEKHSLQLPTLCYNVYSKSGIMLAQETKSYHGQLLNKTKRFQKVSI